MKNYVPVFLLAAVVIVECGHTFLGSSVHRPLVFHKDAKYPSKLFQKRIEYVNFTLPATFGRYPPSIQGILAYDVTNSDASANITQGGLGYNYVTLRLKSDRAEELHFDIYVYA